MRFVWLAMLFAIASPSVADVLTKRVPPGAEPARILSVVQYAFIKRQWTVESTDAHSVTATINHNRTFVRMKVRLAEGQLLYEVQESARRPVITNPAQNTFTGGNSSANPDRWIRALKKDIESTLVLLGAVD